MKVVIGADIVPTKSNQEFFEQARMEQIVDSRILDILSEADYRIFNLEVPLTDKMTPISKCGPNLIASTKSVEGLKQLGIDFLTLANNHIFDQDEQGLYSTILLLEKAGIAYGGVGSTPFVASKPYIANIENKKVGIYCCAEHEYSIVNDEKPGANPFDPLESFDHINELSNNCDFVIVLYHGGKEHYRYPSPNLQKVCRKFVDKGADLVVCQHSHCIGCEEKYQNRTIVYGQGNFLFDHSKSVYWQTSLLIAIDNSFSVSYIPIQKNGNKVCLPDEDNANTILKEFMDRGEEIKDQRFVKAQYQRFADSYISSYLSIAAGKEFHLPELVINKLTNNRFIDEYMKRKYSHQKRLALENKLACESHHELFLAGLRNLR